MGKSVKYRYIEFFAFDYDSLPISFQSGIAEKGNECKINGRSARGRPRFGWMDGVKRALNDGMDVREASERARDRNEWRMIVTQF